MPASLEREVIKNADRAINGRVESSIDKYIDINSVTPARSIIPDADSKIRPINSAFSLRKLSGRSPDAIITKKVIVRISNLK